MDERPDMMDESRGPGSENDLEVNLISWKHIFPPRISIHVEAVRDCRDTPKFLLRRLALGNYLIGPNQIYSVELIAFPLGIAHQWSGYNMAAICSEDCKTYVCVCGVWTREDFCNPRHSLVSPLTNPSSFKIKHAVWSWFILLIWPTDIKGHDKIKVKPHVIQSQAEVNGFLHDTEFRQIRSDFSQWSTCLSFLEHPEDICSLNLFAVLNCSFIQCWSSGFDDMASLKTSSAWKIDLNQR